MRKSTIWMLISLIICVGGFAYGMTINDAKTSLSLVFIGFFMALFGLPFWMATGEEWQRIADSL